MRLAKKFTFFSDLNAFKSIKITKKSIEFQTKNISLDLKYQESTVSRKKLRVRVFVKKPEGIQKNN